MFLPASQSTLRSETLTLVAALGRLGAAVDAVDVAALDRAGLCAVLARRHDAVYAVAGSQFRPGRGEEERERAAVILDLTHGPLILRLGDPPFFPSYLAALDRLRHRAVISARDIHFADFLDGAGIRPRGVAYAPGRYREDDHREVAAVDAPGRDIPFLFVASLSDPEQALAPLRNILPQRVELALALSAALAADSARPARRVAEAVYAETDPDLVPWRGQGRMMLEAACQHVSARVRLDIIGRLWAHEGVIVTNEGRLPAACRGPRRATLLPPMPPDGVAALLRRSRLAISVPPRWIIGAVSERVYGAMAAGVPVCERRGPGMDRHFEAGSHYLAYGPGLDGLEDAVIRARADPASLAGMAAAARERVKGCFASLPNARMLFAPLMALPDMATP
ncbi:MAG: hypothetical protein OHK0024_31310 [Thalassobaculales bacterium]